MTLPGVWPEVVGALLGVPVGLFVFWVFVRWMERWGRR
jgi:hypothetical protein